MAVLKQGIMGGFSGKIGNVIGTSWKGIAVMKAMPLSVANPRTAAQITNRERFQTSVLFAQSILVDTIKPCLDRAAQKMSGYNMFLSVNAQLFDETTITTPASLKISSGRVASAGSDLAGSVQ